MGAKAVSNYLDKKKINIYEAKFLMSFANNANPIFILSTVAIATLNNLNYGILLLFSHYLSSLIILLCNILHKSIIHESITFLKSNDNISDKKLHKTIFEILNDSIKKTYLTLSQILAYIILFNILSEEITIILKLLQIPNNYIYIVQALFESTKGIKNIALNFEGNISTILTLISFILGFSGLSIIFQIYSCIYNTKISLKHILKYKILQGLISATITIITTKIYNIEFSNFSLTSFNNSSYFLMIVSLLFIFAASIKKVTRKFTS